MDKAKIVYEYIKTVVMRACCVFTFTCLLLYSFINLFKSSSDSDKLLFNNSYFTYILVFSLVIGLASLILKIKAIPKALAIAINYVVATVDFILVMEVWTGISTTSKQILFGAIGFSIIYSTNLFSSHGSAIFARPVDLALSLGSSGSAIFAPP